MAGRLAALRAGRRAALLALVGAVVAVHGCVATALVDRLGELHAAQAAPARIEVAYVRELAPAAPPAVAPAPAAMATQATAAPRARRALRPPKAAMPAASEVQRDAPELASESPPPGAPAEAPATMLPPLADAALPASAPGEVALASVPDDAAAAASAPVAEPPPTAAAAEPAPPSATALANTPEPAASSPAAPPFDWPVSTRLTYRLTGYYRGEVAGDAQVEWVRVGSRYQVHLDIGIGPSVAPLITRRMTSDGEITSEGLSPRRYDEDTKVVFRDRQHRTLLFDADTVVLSNGDRRGRLAGTQDAASQFVQLSYLFTTRPELLRPGASVELPLALPRRVERWTYDVLEAETLATPIGDLPTFHLKPRREVAKAGGDLVAEIWYAPSLRYLPVRIRIRQDADTFLDLLIARKPEIAGGP